MIQAGRKYRGQHAAFWGVKRVGEGVCFVGALRKVRPEKGRS